MAVQSVESTGTKTEELIIVRLYEAPVERVWQAWTDPEQVKRWWGPEYFTAPACQIDFRVGGKYLFCMRSPDGQNYWSTGVYREIVPLKRIVCTDDFADEHGNPIPASEYGLPGDWPEELVLTLTFEDLGGKTRLTLRHTGHPAGQMREMAEAGWNGSLDKLAASLQ